MAHVYHWKHGWIPLTHTAALSKAKGNHEAAARMLEDAHSPTAGIHTRQDVAKAVSGLPSVPSGERDAARRDVQAAADQHGAHDLLPSTLRRNEAAAAHGAKADTLEARAMAKRDEAARIAAGAGVSDRAAGRLSASGLKQAHRSTDSQLRRYTEAEQAAKELEHKAALARSREAEAARTRLTTAELHDADLIHDGTGWREVVRTNAKSVTVKTPYSWTDSIAIDKIHKHHTVSDVSKLSTERLKQIVADAKAGRGNAKERLPAVLAALRSRGA